MPSTFLVSDTHFGHTNIITYSSRPFKTVDEMNEALIHRWNAVVAPDDIVYHLGDFSMGGVPSSTFRRRLNGRIHLLVGNHDQRALKEPELWESIHDILHTKIEGQRVTLCHYSMKTWLKSHHGAYQLFGHSHGSLPDDPHSLSFDVGVDCHDLTPLRWDQVVAIMSRKQYKPVDHHGAREGQE